MTNPIRCKLSSGLLTMQRVIVLACLVLSVPSGMDAQTFPVSWTLIETDPVSGGCDNHRDVVATFYAVDTEYIYLRFENEDLAGWPGTGTGNSDKARYKWWIDTNFGDIAFSGQNVINGEFLLFLEDMTDNLNDPIEDRDALGELTLMDDLSNLGLTTRWGGNPPAYFTGTPNTGGPSIHWKRVLGSGTPGLGGPQSSMSDPDLGYRIEGAYIDIYISWVSLDVTDQICLIWATDIHNPNLDQAPECDSSGSTNCFTILAPTSTPTETPLPTETPTPEVPTCPPDTIYGHRVHAPWEPYNDFTSDQGTGNYAFDNFQGLDDVICDVHWWGYEWDWVFGGPCPKSVPFDIVFYTDNGGEPGTEVARYPVYPTRSPTGLFFGPYELIYYGVTLTECLDLPTGWISIQAQFDPQQPDCQFIWITSPEGDNLLMQYTVGGGYFPWEADLSFCLTNTEPTPVPTDTPTETPTPRLTDTPTATPTPRLTDTPTATPTGTPTSRPTDTPTETPTPRLTDTPTATPTSTPTSTTTGMPTETPTETPTPELPTCPPDTIFGQEPHGPWESWSFADSDQTYDIYAFDNFYELGDSICNVHWWGFEQEIEVGPCSKDVPFDIVFYTTSGGEPGTEFARRTVIPSKTTTGLIYDFFGYYDVELYYYEAVFDECIDLVNGWISIQAHEDPLQPYCVFSWVTSPYGDGLMYMDFGSGYYPLQMDAAFCLTREESTPTPTETPTETPTMTATDTPTEIPTDTSTETPTGTPSITPTPTMTRTAVPTNTPTADPTHTPTMIPTPTPTPNPTVTPTACVELKIYSWEITFDPPQAVPGDVVNISAPVHNIGEVDADYMEINFSYERTPLDPTDDPNMAPIDRVVLTDIAVGTYKVAETQWDTTGMEPMTYPIYVVAEEVVPEECDPGSSLAQLDLIVPVNLYSFEAEGRNGSVLLKWVTATEVNNLGFNIFQSRDFTSGFERINPTMIPGAGTSFTRHEYSFETPGNLANGIPCFYYLEMVDMWGETTRSHVIAGVPHFSPLDVRLCTVSNRQIYEVDDPMSVRGRLVNSGPGETVELMMGLILNMQYIADIVPVVTTGIPSDLDLDFNLFNHTWTGQEPPGDYIIVTLIWDPDTGELIFLDLNPFRFR